MEEIHKQILVKTTREVKTVGNSKVIYIPAEIVEALDLKDDTPITISLEAGKHGKYIAIWVV